MILQFVKITISFIFMMCHDNYTKQQQLNVTGIPLVAEVPGDID